MFRPESLQKRTKQIKAKRKKNEKNRKRNRILNFRVSQEEYDLINKQVEISGLSKQDYFIQLLGEHKINITADYRVADTIEKEVFQLARVIKKFGKLNDEEQDILLYILEIILSGCTFVINYRLEDNMIKTEQYKRNIPMELRQYKQWLWFKKIRRVDLKGKEKILKLPVSPITLKSSDWNNKENWADFETAVNNIESSGLDGLSFVLSIDDPFICIDLDNVPRDMRERFFRDFHDTYIEFSQSGKGLHIFAKGEIADNFNNQIEKVEMYQNNRCIAMTGNSVAGTSNNIIDKQSEIDRYYVVFCT